MTPDTEKLVRVATHSLRLALQPDHHYHPSTIAALIQLRHVITPIVAKSPLLSLIDTPKSPVTDSGV